MTLLKAVDILKDKIDGLKVRLIGSGVTLNDCKKYVKAVIRILIIGLDLYCWTKNALFSYLCTKIVQELNYTHALSA